MTTLNITANTAKKSARFKGTIAAGEHVAVSIEGVEVASATSLRLRVLGLYGETLAQFPMPESDSGDDGETSPSVAEGEDTWTYEDGVLSCELNLNTVQMLRAVPPAATRRLLFVLDDYDNKTLFFKDVCDVAHWPRRRGEEEPPPDDLDNYKDLIADFNNRLSEAEEDIEDAVSSVQDAVSAVNTAIDSIDGKVGSAVSLAVPEAVANKADKVSPVTSGNFAGLDSNGNLTDSGKKPADFTPASHALDSDIHVTAEQKTAWNGYGASISELQSGKQNALSNNQLAAVNSGITSALVAQIETNKSDITSEASARNNRDNQLAAAISNYASTETAARQDADATLASQISSLSSAKADKATTYTKTEVDTKIAGVQTFQKYLVQTLPDADEADMKGLYLVPTGETSEEGDLCEEWTVVEEDGEKRWEKIGGTTVDLSDYYDKDAVDGLLAGKQPRLTPASVTALGGIKTVWAEVKHQRSTVLLRLPTELITINGKALTSDVTLTGADIAVSGTDATKINAALAGKADEETPIAKLPSNCYPVIMTDNLGTEYTILETDATFTRNDRNSPYELNKVGFFSACMFDKSTGKLSGYAAPFVSAKFNGAEGIIGTWPVITRYPSGGTVVRDQKLLGKVDSVYNATSGNIPELTQNGGIRDSMIPAANVAMRADLRYNLNPITIASSGAATATLADLSTNIIVAAADVTSITFTFPPRQTGKMRDFFVRLVIQGTTVPTLYFNEPDGGGAIAFDADDDAWADIEPGVNILMFSDTAE